MKSLLEYIKHFDHSLGIKREDMPQITHDNLEAYKTFLKSQGISVSQKMVSPWKIKPTQTYIDTDKVSGQVKNIRTGSKPKIIVSSDLYVVDGHHSWSACMEIDPNKPVEVVFIQCAIRKLIDVSHDFRGVKYRSK